ncbi:MAG TPA: hypothetical protein P5307_03615, partial [Pirellulaceae bacterium]|nr:hypothetical protein [Pirellulaceae bacterium]
GLTGGFVQYDASTFHAIVNHLMGVVGSGTLCRMSGTPARQETAKSGHPTFRSFKLYHYRVVGLLAQTRRLD